MSTEAEAVLQTARQLPPDQRRAIAEALLAEMRPPARSLAQARSFVPLPDVPPMKDHDEGFAEAIMACKGMIPRTDD